MYAKYFKRIIDFILSLIALIILSPILLVLIIVTAIAMKGNPFFTQQRPGKDEKIFILIKFRTMTSEHDESGELLPDDKRLNKFGKMLRSTSLDELPALLNILKGDMSIVGPRPQLVRDMTFMTKNERARHSVRPGLTGLAQVNGRNAIKWEQKFYYDLQYIENITFLEDVKIILDTFIKVLKRADISEEGMDTAEDLGDYLLNSGKITVEEYEEKQRLAKELIEVV